MRLWFALILSFLATAVGAVDIGVRTGEHDSFSRFVLTLPPGTPWSVSRTSEGYAVQLEATDIRFVTDTIFERIPRTRVSSVDDAGDGRLILRLACDACHADAFLWQADKLVLDIIDGQGDDVGPEPTAVAQVLPVVTPRLPAALPRANLSFSPPSAPAPPGPAFTYSQQGLAETIARAVSQGLLDPREVHMPELESAPDSPQEPRHTDTHAPDPETAAQPPPLRASTPGVTVGTAIDRELSMLGTALGDLNSDPCFDPATFAVSDWADSRPFPEQIAELSAGLSKELDRTSDDAVLRLARGYIHFGFGQEALTTLTMLDGNSQDRAILATLARAMDGLAPQGRTLAGQVGCDNGASPWVVMSGAAEMRDVDRDALLRSYRALPHTLQAVLAARLSQALLDTGDVDGAAFVLGSVPGEDADRATDIAEARAALAETTGGADAALTLLENQIGDDARMSATAMVRLVDLAIASGRAPDPGVLELVAAARQEMKGAPIATDLLLAEAKGYAAIGDFRLAFNLLADAGHRIPLDVREALASDFALAVTERAEDAQFLDLVFSDLPSGLSAEVENKVAGRLIALNFPEKAAEYLRGTATQADMAERRYLRAEAALALDQPEEALVHLQGLSDSRAEAIRARALGRLGDYRAALSSMPSSQSGQPDAIAAFRANAWEQLSLGNDPLLAEIAEDALTESDPADLNGLADRHTALEEAKAVRQRVEALLERFPVEDIETVPTN